MRASHLDGQRGEAAVTLGPGEEQREERISEQSQRFLGEKRHCFISHRQAVCLICPRSGPVNSDSVARGERALPWRFVTAAVLIVFDRVTIRLDPQQGRSVYTSILKLFFSQERLCNPQL